MGDKSQKLERHMEVHERKFEKNIHVLSCLFVQVEGGVLSKQGINEFKGARVVRLQEDAQSDTGFGSDGPLASDIETIKGLLVSQWFGHRLGDLMAQVGEPDEALLQID